MGGILATGGRLVIAGLPYIIQGGKLVLAKGKQLLTSRTAGKIATTGAVIGAGAVVADRGIKRAVTSPALLGLVAAGAAAWWLTREHR